MKKIFLLMLVAMFAAVSCQKSELTTQNGSGDEVTVNISAVMQSDNATTRVIDANGKATEINRCIMEIYTSDEELYQRQVTSVDETSLKATFSINLVPDKTYDFVFWADYSTDSESDYYYTTTSLKEITANYSEYDGNDEKRDAFFARVNQPITASESNVEAKLYRPFGQVNVSTYVKDLIESYLPTTVQVTYTSSNIATTFNAFDGTTDGSTDIVWKEAVGVIDNITAGSAELFHLSTDYIFAPKEGQALIDFKMEFFNDGASIMTNDKFTSIPVQRNYRTNISGNLLTIGSDITVEVVPTFNESDIEVKVTTVETVAEVANALEVVLEGDDANVTVSGTVKGDSDENHIVVPDSNDKTGDTEINLSFDDVDTGAAISFGGENSGDESTYDGTINITTPEGVTLDDLSINLPNAHIVFNGVAQDVDEASADGTFVIAEGASVVNLTVNAGNVAVYGTVTTIAQGTDNTSITEVTIYTQGKGVETASTMVGNLTELQANTAEFKVVIINDDIQNVTTGQYYATIKEAIAAANENDVIELAAGEYNEELTINRPLTIKGAQAGVSGLSDDRNDLSKESRITKTLRMAETVDGTVTLDGLYFPQADGTSYRIYVNNIKKLVVTNSIADGIEGNFVYSDEQSTFKEEVEVTNNKVIGTYGSHTHIFVYNTKKMTITNNYLSTAGRAINLAVTEAHNSYDENYTQAIIENNTITNMSNYAVQTSYYPYGKIVINNNAISEIYGGKDGEEEGSINIRGYQDSNSVLEYQYEITNNTFTDVESLFLARLYNKADGSGLEIGDDKVVIKGNTINNVAQWILRCDDEKDYKGTIDLSDNNISYTGDFADYLYLLGDAKVKYDGVEYSYVYPVYNTTQDVGYTDLATAVSQAINGDTLKLAAGEYTSGLTIDKELILEGPNAGIAGYSEERVAEATFTTNSIKFESNNITLDGIAMDGATMSMDYELANITLKNLYVANIGYYFCRNTGKYGDITNLIVENSKFYNIYSGSGEPFVFFLYNLVSAEFRNNVFDEIDKHALNNQLSENATEYVIKNNTFRNITSAGIQIPNTNTGKILIEGNTFENCVYATTVYTYKSKGVFAGQIDITENNMSNVRIVACIGANDDVSEVAGPMAFEDGAYVKIYENEISLDYWNSIYYSYLLYAFNYYDGVVEFDNNDFSGGKSGVYDSVENLLKTKNAFRTNGDPCTQVQIDGVLYQPTSDGYYLEKVEE